MDLSVVVPTLNGRTQLATTLDALAERVPDAEVVVVNGPSTDGTTGMVRDRADVDALVEVADRPVAPARNAGIDHATGAVIALVDQGLVVSDTWVEAVQRGIEDFRTTREAMNGTDLTDQPAIRQRVNNGILEYTFVKRRGNYLLPPRSHRALPEPQPGA
jgi:glycosyltransferase involved in cell wall biosynthesis